MKRRTVGLIIPSLHLPWEDIQIEGIIRAGKQADLNVIILPGGRLDSREMKESSRNVIYSLADSNNLDGLIIWTAGLSELVTPERLGDFINSFNPLPTVLLECRYDGYDHIYADSYHPMKQIITHLIKDHNLRGIGYVCGEKHHTMAEERFLAYKDALRESGLAYKEELVFQTVHTYDEELEIKRLIEWYQNVKDELTGVAVFNDTRARQFINAMTRIGVSIPGDLAVCSYDDTPNSLYGHPYLSTVHSPFREIGQEAIKAIIEKMDGRTKLFDISVSGSIVIRESCGCSIVDDEGHRRKVENLAESLGEKMHNLQLVNSMRAYLKASPDFREKRENFESVFTDFLIRASIPTFKIYLYEKAGTLYEYYSFSKGILQIPSERKFTIDDIKHSSDNKREDRFTFIILPLFSKSINFGFAILEPGTGDGDFYETIMYILGSYFEENRLLTSLHNQNEKLSTTVENLNATRNMLVQSEKIAALSNLTGGIAHQINTPLGIAITAVSYLESCFENFRESESAEKDKTGKALITSLDKSLPIASDNLKRVADLVSSFKNIAVENISGERRSIVLDLYLKEQMANFQTLWNNRVSIKVISDDSFSIECYPAILSQILSILVGNSVKHGCSGENHPLITLEIIREKDKTVLLFSDDGPGISKDIRGRIFDPFFSTVGGNENPGLGLFIVHNLVTYKLKGSITLIDIPDGSACFRIVLPE